MIVVVLVLYLAMMAAIGLYCARFNRDIGDFVLGGRRLGPWVTAFSAQASDFSGWLLIGLPSMAYLGGLSMTWTCIGCAGGVMFDWLVVAPQLRRQSEKYDALTVPDYLAARFNDRNHLIRILAVVTILVFYVAYIAAQFMAAGSVFKIVFTEVPLPWGAPRGFDYYRQGLLIGAAIILLYTSVGGFLAVSWTDFVQAILMVFTAVVLPVMGIIHVGGLSAMWERLSAGPLGADMLTITAGKTGASFIFGVVGGGLAWGVGYPGQPHIIARFMAIREPRKIPMSATIAMVWSVVALWGSMFIGLVAMAVIGPELADGHKDEAMPRLAVTVLPSALAGLVLSGGLAAMMSTVDSQLIVAMSAVVRDIYEKLLGGHPSDRKAVTLSRVVVLGFGVLGVALAWRGSDVFGQVLDAWGGLAAGLGPAIVLGCVWRRASRAGIGVGMLIGMLLAQGWVWGPVMKLVAMAAPSAATHLEPIKLVVCFAANLVTVVAISLVRPAPPVKPA